MRVVWKPNHLPAASLAGLAVLKAPRKRVCPKRPPLFGAGEPAAFDQMRVVCQASGPGTLSRALVLRLVAPGPCQRGAVSRAIALLREDPETAHPYYRVPS